VYRPRAEVDRQKVESELELYQRSGLSCDPDLSLGERQPGFVVPDLDGDDPSETVLGEPHDGVDVVGPEVVIADSGDGRPQRRRGCLVAFCYTQSEGYP